MCGLFKAQDEVRFKPCPRGGPGEDVKPPRDDFSAEEIPYAGKWQAVASENMV